MIALPNRRRPRSLRFALVCLWAALACGPPDATRETATVARPQNFTKVRDRLFLRGNLAGFYKSLRELERGRRDIVRIMMFGDSIIWGDCLTIRMKRRFQNDFGDGGRGLLNIVDEPATRLMDHANFTRGGWQRFKIPYESFGIPPFPDLGFTGFSYRPFTGGATTHAVGARSPVQDLPRWRARARQLGLPYTIPELGTPIHARHDTRGESWRNLRLVLRSPDAPDRSAVAPAPTRATVLATTESGSTETIEREIDLSPGATERLDISLPPTRRLSLRFSGTRPFVDGMAVETRQGVGFSAIVLRGLHQTWLLGVPERQFSAGYRAYDPDLVIFQFGINESHSMQLAARGFSAARYEDQLRRFYERLRKAAPRASILLMGPWERMIHHRTYPAHARVREIQKRVAHEMGLAYFDGFRFMKGTAGFLNLARAGLIQSDLTHVSYPGGHYVADGMYAKLMKDYRDWPGE